MGGSKYSIHLWWLFKLCITLAKTRGKGGRLRGTWEGRGMA